jgi:hypothetical protein
MVFRNSFCVYFDEMKKTMVPGSIYERPTPNIGGYYIDVSILTGRVDRKELLNLNQRTVVSL